MPSEEGSPALSEPGGGVERLKDAYLALLRDGPPAAGGCTPPEEIWALARGEAAGDRARAALLHAMSCPVCSEAWRLARELGTKVPRDDRRRWHERRWTILAAAAAVLLGVFFVSRVGERAPHRLPVYREGDRPAIATSVPEDTPVPRARLLLSWTAGPEGTLYDVEVATAAMERVASIRGLERNELTVPEEALRGLPSGSRLLWRVEALHPDGTRTSSRTFVVLLD